MNYIGATLWNTILGIPAFIFFSILLGAEQNSARLVVVHINTWNSSIKITIEDPKSIYAVLDHTRGIRNVERVSSTTFHNHQLDHLLLLLPL